MTVYLIVKNLEGLIDESIIPLVNERNGHLSTFPEIESGDSWGDLKNAFISSAAEKGRGGEIVKFKDGVEYWVLPFTTHPDMSQPESPEDAFVLDKESYISYEWDVEEQD